MEAYTMTQPFTSGYALLVGVTESRVPKWALPDVAKDVAALEAVLTHPQRCAYLPDHVKTLTGSAASRDGILAGLEWLQDQLAADASGNATAVVSFSGHGWREGGAYYLVPYDVQEGRIASRSLRAQDFAGEIAALAPRRLLVLLDCCHAGGMGVKGGEELPEGYAAAAVPPALLMGAEKGVSGAKVLGDLARGHGRAVLSSSTGEQSSSVRRDRAMSIFTYHLVEALTGHAEPKEGATEVLISDVMGHVTRQVPQSAQADWGRVQEPDFQVSGNFPMALLLGGVGLSKGQPAPDPLDPLPDVADGATRHAEVHGSGAIAQGAGAVAAGERGVAVGGDVRESVIRTGDVVHTGGGPYIRGGVKVGGDWVDRDKIEIHAGEGSAVAWGEGSTAAVARPVDPEAVARAFQVFYAAVEARPDTPALDRAELKADLKDVEQEVAKGEDADEGFIARRLRNIRHMAPDILEVVLTTMLNPISGLGKVVERVAEKMRAERAEERE
jgi:hypothetical protein